MSDATISVDATIRPEAKAGTDESIRVARDWIARALS